jgi:MazG family protein
MPAKRPPRRLPSHLGRRFEKLVAVQARLHARGGCPWDREQTHQSLRPYLIEEAYEVLEALDSGDDKRFASELGDLLLQVVFHAQLASETGRFDIGDVVDAIREKLVRRHPHVFGSASAKNSAEVLRRWEELKAEERRQEGRPDHGSLLDGVPRNLPALAEAFQLTRRAANVGFDWPRLGAVLDKLDEETRELRRAARSPRPSNGRSRPARKPRAAAAARRAHARIEEEAGDLLFVAANVARVLGLDPEITLKKANRKFERRFQSMEAQAAEAGERLAQLSSRELERLWSRAKARELH